MTTLREEIRYVHVFIIAFKQTDNSVTNSIRSIISLFEKMFGKKFWDNAILEVWTVYVNVLRCTMFVFRPHIGIMGRMLREFECIQNHQLHRGSGLTSLLTRTTIMTVNMRLKCFITILRYCLTMPCPEILFNVR